MASKTTYQLDVLLGAKTRSSFQSNLSNAANGIQSLSSIAQRVALGVTAAFAAVNLTGAIESAVETYSEFEQEMATVAAISQATQSEYERMEEASLAAGRSTIYTAAEAASALEYMALAGWDVETSIRAQTPILRMAAATQKELGTTSDLVTDSMSALGLGADELEGYLNRLIAGNNSANTTAEQLMESLVRAGGASRTLGADLDDTITALGILANNGVKGEEAGTAINAIFARIAANTTALKELDRIGVSIFDDGSFVGLEESLVGINKAMMEMTDEQKAQSLARIAGVHHQGQFAYLLDAVKDTGAETTKWQDLEADIINSGGALANMYDTTTNTLLNAQAILNSAKEDMQIRIVDVFADDYKDFLLWLAEKLPEITDSIVEFAEAHKGEFADALKTAGGLIESVWNTGSKAVSWLLGHKGVIAGSITTIGTALTAGKVVSGVKGLVGALSGLASTGPVGLGVAALGLTAGAIVGVSIALKEADERAAALDLAAHFGQISLSLEEIDTLARQIVGKGSIGGVKDFLNAIGESANSLDQITDILGDLQKESWKINVGFDMTTEDYEDYASQLESYISGVEDYAADKGYEIHLAASLLFGAGSLQDKESGQFYEQIQGQLAKYGDELQAFLYGEGEEVGGALADGIIDSLEDIKIQEILGKMNEITSAITEAESRAKFDALMLQYNGADLDSESILKVLEDLEQYESEVREGARQAYESTMTSNYARLNLDENYTYEDFSKDKKEAWIAYLKKSEEAEVNSAVYALDTLEKSYPELSGYMKQYESIPQEVINKWTDPENEQLIARLKTSPEEAWNAMTVEMYQKLRENFETDMPKGLKEYVDAMAPAMETLEKGAAEIQKAGGNLDAETMEALSQWQAIKGITYLDGEELSSTLREYFAPDGQMYDFLADKDLFSDTEMSMWQPYTGKRSGSITYDIPSQAIRAHEEMERTLEEANADWANSKTVEESITQQAQEMYDKTGNALEEAYGKGFDIEASLNVLLNPNYKGMESNLDMARLPYSLAMEGISESNSRAESRTSNRSKMQGGAYIKIASNAQGGIYDHPILTTFAEEGPEAALPLDGSLRARSLWIQAGEILGMFQGKTRDQILMDGISAPDSAPAAVNSSGNIYVELNPTITIQGNADREEVQKAVSWTVDELKEVLSDIIREKERTAL